MIPNPQMLMGAVIAAGVIGAGSYFYGRHEGAKLERLAWEQRENEVLRKANLALDMMRKRIADQEHQHAEELAALAGMHDEEQSHVESERDAAIAAVRRGDVRLRANEATARLTCDVRVSTATASAAGSEQAAEEGRLSRERAEAAVRLLSEADELAGEVNYCWGVVLKDREIVNR